MATLHINNTRSSTVYINWRVNGGSEWAGPTVVQKKSLGEVLGLPRMSTLELRAQKSEDGDSAVDYQVIVSGNVDGNDDLLSGEFAEFTIGRKAPGGPTGDIRRIHPNSALLLWDDLDRTRSLGAATRFIDGTG